MSKSILLKAAVLLPVLCFSFVFAQGVSPSRPANSPGNALAAYVFGGEEMRGENGELLAETVVNNLVATGRYSNPRRGAREFFRAVDREQARNRGRILEDRNFCRIGGDEGVQFLVIIDIESAGRGNSVWARLLDLDGCKIIGTAEFTGLVRNNNEINAAARELANELVHRRMNRRGGGGGGASVGGPSRGRTVRREFTTAGNHSFTFNEGFPATIEIYVLGAGGGGQGGHSAMYGNPVNNRTERGSGAAGGGGTASYMKINARNSVTFNISVGAGGAAGGNNHRGLGQSWESGREGGRGGSTVVSFGSTTLTAEGGHGGGGGGRNLTGGASGAGSQAPAGQLDWATTPGQKGADGVHQGDLRASSRGGSAGAVTRKGSESSFGGGSGAASNTAAQAGGGGRGGFDRESGTAGGNGRVLIVITY